MTMKQIIAKELLVVARDLLAVDFATKEEFDKYMKDHPDANRSNHRVVKNKKQLGLNVPLTREEKVKLLEDFKRKTEEEDEKNKMSPEEMEKFKKDLNEMNQKSKEMSDRDIERQKKKQEKKQENPNAKIAHELLMVAKDLMSKEAWKNWGWLNGHSAMEARRFDEQQKKHEMDRKRNPSEHKTLENTSTTRGYAHYKCSCGFEFQSDSSD